MDKKIEVLSTFSEVLLWIIFIDFVCKTYEFCKHRVGWAETEGFDTMVHQPAEREKQL